jgi:hypothetical protein
MEKIRGSGRTLSTPPRKRLRRYLWDVLGGYLGGDLVWSLGVM